MTTISSTRVKASKEFLFVLNIKYN
jgi:hypothetical protein